MREALSALVSLELPAREMLIELHRVYNLVDGSFVGAAH